MSRRLASIGRRIRSRLSPVLLAALVPATLASCAKTGEPHPPTVLVPKPAVNLAVIEYGEQILLTVSMPTENTNGTPITTLREIELLRRVEKDRATVQPLSPSEFAEGAVPVLRIPAEKAPEYSNNGILTFRDDLSTSDLPAAYSSGFRYAIRFINRKKQSAGLSNQVFIAPVPIPPPPSNLEGEVSQQSVRVHWMSPSANVDGSAPPRLLGYNIYRSEDPNKFPPGPLNSEPLQKPEFNDRTFQFDKTYYYEVSIVANGENPYAETKPSAALTMIPRDVFPPGAPQNLNAVANDGIVLLLWAAPADSDLAGYRILRRDDPAGRSVAVQPGLVTALSYRDEKVEHGRRYLYSVVAVDTHGNVGPAAEAEVDVR